MPVLGLAEHRSDEPVKQIDGLIRQRGAEVEGNGGQGRVAAPAFIAGDMLRRGAAGLAGKLGEARLVHAMSVGGIDADRAEMGYPLDQAEHRGGLCRFRHLTQPDEPTLTTFWPALCQRIKLPPLRGRQPADEPPFDLPPPLKAEIDAEAFEAPGWRDDDPAPPAFRHDQFRQIEETVGFDRLRLDGARNFAGGAPAEGTQAQPLLTFDGVSLPVPLRREIVLDRRRQRVNLLRDERNQRGWGSLTRFQRAAGIPQIAQHQCVAEAVVVAAVAPNRSEITGRQRVVAHQFTAIGRRIEQRGDLGLGQLRSAHR